MNKEEKNSTKCPICGRPTHKESKYCIFHASAEEKTVKEFKKALKEYIQEINEEDKDYDFERFVFIGDIIFEEDLNVTILKNAVFKDASFEGNAGFWNTTFQGVAVFREATFKGFAVFRKATFEGESDFEGATFKRSAVFREATFKGFAVFRKATFEGESDFEGATFKRFAVFRMATFWGKTEFRKATFGRCADLEDSIFQKEANFTRTIFQGYANFKRAIFNGFANFLESKFYSGGNFKKSSFKGDTNIEVNLDYYGDLKQPKTVFSTGTDFKKFRFYKDFPITLNLKPADDSQIKYRKKIVDLENQVNDLLKTLQIKSSQKAAFKEELEEINKKWEILNNNKKIVDLSNKICEIGGNKLFKSTKFRNLFEREKCFAAVLAIDIRRSTEIMLKAKSPKKYAYFISSLCVKMMDIIKTNFGVVDKFTGDGVLAFFPEFYTGPDAIYFTLNSAKKCNNYFKKHYDNCRTSFSTILKEVGLGIGIDYGETSLVEINNALTVVGIPVVYACRLSNANLGEILLNQSAYEVSIVKHKKCCQYNESELNIKHEGKITVYKLEKYIFPRDIIYPEWIKK